MGHRREKAQKGRFRVPTHPLALSCPPRSPTRLLALTQQELATLMLRPRGWHLDEGHVTVDGSVVSGALFDFALFFFHNCKTRLGKGTGPYFYLPKLESHQEARLWNDVFRASQVGFFK